MATVIKAIYEDGVFKPEEPVDIPEHTRVEVSVATDGASVAADTPPQDHQTGWTAMRRLVGLAAEADTSDGTASVGHDEFLYGRRR